MFDLDISYFHIFMLLVFLLLASLYVSVLIDYLYAFHMSYLDCLLFTVR